MAEAKRTDMDDTTILIKTFERPRSLRRLLKSIFFYYPKIKVIVADDSTDPDRTKRAVMERWPGKEIEYLNLPYDVGLSEGRNRALDRVKTPYFVLCDDDFVFDCRTDLKLMKRQLGEHKVDLVAGMYFEANPKIRSSRLARIRENILGLLYDIGFRFSLPHRRVSAFRFDYDPASKKLTLIKLDVDKGNLIKAGMAPNFFLAKTSIRSKVKWRPQLKMGEHLVFFWDFKKRGFKLLINTEVGVNHIRSMPLNYKMKRHKNHDEYERLASKIMKSSKTMKLRSIRRQL